MKKTYLAFLSIAVLLLFINAFIIKEKDPLNKRTYETKLLEIKEGQANIKPKADEMEFKGGKVYSKILDEKYQYKWLKYNINVDSTFTDQNEVEASYFEVEVNFTDDKEQDVRMICKINK